MEMAEHGQSSSTWNDAEASKLPEKVAEMKLNGELKSNGDVTNSGVLNGTPRKRVVVVGLGMVGVAFMQVISLSQLNERIANGFQH
jgi:nitrite reductase (NAD(P)H)